MTDDKLYEMGCSGSCGIADEKTLLSRRKFGAASLATAGLAAAPWAASAQGMAVKETDVMIETADGTCDAVFTHPETGAHAGVIVWPDIFGLRPTFRDMGKRLAADGYAVLTVNPFYRSSPAPAPKPGFDFNNPDDRAMVNEMRALFADFGTIESDAEAFVKFLDSQAAVDTGRKIGTTGYCMGGPLTMRTAAAVPNRIGAGGSFHGGGLVTDSPDSPHLLVSKMKAHYLFAIAANDDERQPEAKNVLRETFAEADLPAEIEVYEGANHGWCVPDGAVYHEAQAERAWSRLLHLFGTALA